MNRASRLQLDAREDPVITEVAPFARNVAFRFGTAEWVTVAPNLVHGLEIVEDLRGLPPGQSLNELIASVFPEPLPVVPALSVVVDPPPFPLPPADLPLPQSPVDSDLASSGPSLPTLSPSVTPTSSPVESATTRSLPLVSGDVTQDPSPPQTCRRLPALHSATTDPSLDLTVPGDPPAPVVLSGRNSRVRDASVSSSPVEVRAVARRAVSRLLLPLVFLA